VVIPGNDASFTITVTNNGDVNLTGIQVIDVLAPNCDRIIGLLSPGMSTGYTCTMVAPQTAMTNIASVTAIAPDASIVSSTSQASFTIGGSS
jgi:uncharacterized repeat protein (TIGR01451 family)